MFRKPIIVLLQVKELRGLSPRANYAVKLVGEVSDNFCG
jgi:hypothetical protein